MSAEAHTHMADDGHGSMKPLVVGFVLSLILTAISFAAVMGGYVPKDDILTVISVSAEVQLIVQVMCFLNIGAKPGQRRNTVIFLLTGFIISIVVAGSLWVMHNANVNMMPGQMTIEQAKMSD